ncbi:MAG: hypothetical protein ACRC2R_04140 [Xenococcaceae cyanobacterium]
MRFFTKIIGLTLLLIGIYFLGQNIFFTTYISSYWWQDISAAASAIALMLGTILLIFFSRSTGNLGWKLIIFGTVLVVVSGKVFLKPTSLWYFFISFAAMMTGFQLIRTGRINF